MPSLIPDNTQSELISRLLHRDLATEKHQTNLHKHYNIPYGLSVEDNRHTKSQAATEDNIPSFFRTSPSSETSFEPLDADIHKPLTISQALNKKLRWITLGGQYDWTLKKYPVEEPPSFPKDIADLVRHAFPAIKPEAAIVNVYSPGDTLSLHRDVSEESDQGIISISLGCDAIFIVGLAGIAGEESTGIAIRLRSGDAVYMSGRSRYAWHGVPSILRGSCPQRLSQWPASLPQSEFEDFEKQDIGAFESWRGWMSTKRVNLNIRQMKH